MTLVLGIDIGGTKTAFVVGDRAGRIIARTQFDSNADRGYAALLNDILDGARDLLRDYPDIAAVGASVGGPLDAERGMVLGPPHLPGWGNVLLANDLSTALGLPAGIEHDAKAGALAEWQFGAGRGTRDMVFLTLGTGIGAGIIANGQLLRGVRNGAGEIGHWRAAEDGPDFYGKRGSLEGIASGGGVAAYARWRFSKSLSDVADARTLGARAAAGDRDASTAISDAGRILGDALSRLIDLLAPERIVLGSLAQRLGPLFTDPLREVVAREALPQTRAQCDIVNGQLGDAIGDVAALSVALTTLPFSGKDCD